MGKKGFFLILEGLDGSGTTTQAALLKQDFLTDEKTWGKWITTYEPTPGPAGALARLALNQRLLLDKTTLALLFAADRTDHLYKEAGGLQEPGLAHRLSEGINVLCDRYLLSSLAYQSLDLPMDWILEINQQALIPDLTVYIDIEPEVAQKRLHAGRSHQDLFEAIDIQNKVREKYEEGILLLTKKGHPIRRVDGNLPQEVIKNQIKELILDFVV